MLTPQCVICIKHMQTNFQKQPIKYQGIILYFAIPSRNLNLRLTLKITHEKACFAFCVDITLFSMQTLAVNLPTISILKLMGVLWQEYINKLLQSTACLRKK
jgi:hypothetical protein